MEVTEREPRGGRSDKVGSRAHDVAVVTGCKSDCAGAVAAGRGGLKVYREEGGWIMHGDAGQCYTSMRSICRAKSPNRGGTTGSGWLSLIDHSVDVAAVAEALLNLPTIRARLGSLAGRELSDVDIARLCFLVGLHDAGKVNHGFQARLAGKKPAAGHIGPLWAILGSVPLTREDRMVRRDVRHPVHMN